MHGLYSGTFVEKIFAMITMYPLRVSRLVRLRPLLSCRRRGDLGSIGDLFFINTSTPRNGLSEKSGLSSLSRYYSSFSPIRASAEREAFQAPALVCNIRCTINSVPGHLAEELCDLLLGTGALSAGIEEFRPDGAAEQKIYDVDGQKVWDRCKVVALYPMGTDMEEECVAYARAVLEEEPDWGSEEGACRSGGAW